MNEIRFDKYRLLERISHGGMAEVFRAKTFGAAGFEREVAIKLLLPTVAMDREFITMLIDEAKIAGQLNHANIAQIFDLGMAEGRYYIVQEYVNGRDLRAIIRRCRSLKQPLSVPQACHIMLKVCEGLDYAHNKRDPNGQPLNLVHRDVSPQNILLGMDGQVKLIDFGIAKAEGRATRTLAGLVKGKFAYMSPEQIRGLPVDRRSDVFACGIVFHELLTASPLFLRKSEFETLKRARSGEIEPPSNTNPAVPEDLDEIVLKALTRHVDDRYQSAQDFREAIWDFIKSSGNFYSQGQMAEWMRDTFGTPDELTQNTAVTTERDQQLRSISEFEPTGDETGRTAEEPRRRPALGDQFMGIPMTPTPPPPFGEPDPGATAPEIPVSGRRRPSGRHAADFASATDDPTSVDGPGGMPGPFGRPSLSGRMPFGDEASGERTRDESSPIPFSPRQDESARIPFSVRRDESGPIPFSGRTGSSVRRANAYVEPPAAHVGGQFAPMPPGMEDDETSRPDDRGLPLVADPTAPPTRAPLSAARQVPIAQRTSRHSMRALTDLSDDDAPRPKRRRMHLLVAGALLLLLAAGAASIAMTVFGGSEEPSPTETTTQKP